MRVERPHPAVEMVAGGRGSRWREPLAESRRRVGPGMAEKWIFTTWEAGRYCGVSPYTVRHWVRAGKLQAYVTPGGHRRIRRQDLDAFLLAHGMPLPSDFNSGGKRVLLLMSESEGLIRSLEGRSGAFEFRAAPSPFDAGMLLATYDPHLFIVELDAEGWDGLALCRRIHQTPQTAHIQLAALAGEITVELLESAQAAGVLRCFTKPLDPKEVRRLLGVLFPHASWVPSP